MSGKTGRMASITDGYPVVLRLDGRRVLVVGAGPIAARKLESLLACGAQVTVVAPQIVDEIRALAARRLIAMIERRYEQTDLDGVQLVIVSTNDSSIQQQVFDDCQARGLWCNAADDPDRCSFILPAVARRGPVIVAVSTQGSSPALAGVLRDILAEALPANVQDEFLRTIIGLENVKVARYGYAVEYDFIEPTQIFHTLETRTIGSLFLAGQINGTSGYEEAAAQGLVAGISAAHKVLGRKEFVLERSQAYIGVLIDDLVTK